MAWSRPFLVLVLTLIFSTTNSSAYAEFWNDPLPYQGEIKIGATLPLTGDYSTYGNLIKDGVELALRELKTEGYNVRSFYEDVPTPGPRAASAAEKLIYSDRINALAANFWNPAIPIMAPVLMKNRIPTFHTAAADDLILSSGDYILCTNSRIGDEAKHTARYVRERLKAQTTAVIYIGTTFGENYSQHFIAEFEKLGGDILMNEMTALGDTDLRSVLLRIKKQNPDVIYAAYFGTNLGIVLKQARQLGITQPILSVYESEDPSVIDTAKSAAEGLKFFIAEPVQVSDSVDRTLKDFKEVYGYSPRILGRNAYDATKLMVYALASCSLNPECTKNALYRIKSYEGISGTISINGDGAATKDFILKTVRSQEFVKVH